MSILIGAGSAGLGLRVLALALGVFMLFMGLDKIDWLSDSAALTALLTEWRGRVGPVSRWYVETIALPGAPAFARIVPVAELAAGVALLVGFRVRLAALLAFLMIVNFHFAGDVIFRYDYLINPYGLPVLGGLAAIALGGKRLPFSVSA